MHVCRVRVDLVYSTCYDIAGGGPYPLSRGFIAALPLINEDS